MSYHLGLSGLSTSSLFVLVKALGFSSITLSLLPLFLYILRVPLASHDELHLVVDAVLLILVSTFDSTFKAATLEAVDAYLLVNAEAFRVAERLCTFDLAEPEWLVGIIKNEMGY